MSKTTVLEQWPDNSLWSSQLLRLLALSYSRAADLAEVMTAVAEVESGDADRWYDAFNNLATQVQKTAADAADHSISARDALWRASMYYRNAGVFLLPSDERAVDAADLRRHSFALAAEQHTDRIEQIEIPFLGESLPGWFCATARAESGPRPVVIVVGGTDGVAEEMYFAVGSALVERGYSVVVFDGPGQGEALRRGQRVRPDFESAISAVIDFVSDRQDVDADRIGLVGHSLGGLYAARAAATDSRIRGTVLASAPFDLLANLSPEDGASDVDEASLAFFVALYCELTGSQSLDEVLLKVSGLHLRHHAKEIRTPLLGLYGADDPLVSVADGERIVSEATSQDAQLIVYPSGTPGSTHCQQDSLPVTQFDLCNWIESHI